MDVSAIDRICASTLPSRERMTLIALFVALRWQASGRVAVAAICAASAIGDRATRDALRTLAVARIVERVEVTGGATDYVVHLDRLTASNTYTLAPDAGVPLHVVHTPLAGNAGVPLHQMQAPPAPDAGVPVPNARVYAPAPAPGVSYLDHDLKQQGEPARVYVREDDFRPPPPPAPPAANDDTVTDASPVERRVAHVVALYTRITGEQPRPGDDMALARWCDNGRPLAAISTALYRMAEEAKRKAGGARPDYSLRFADAVLCRLRREEWDPTHNPAPNRAPTGGPAAVAPPVVDPVKAAQDKREGEFWARRYQDNVRRAQEHTAGAAERVAAMAAAAGLKP